MNFIKTVDGLDFNIFELDGMILFTCAENPSFMLSKHLSHFQKKLQKIEGILEAVIGLNSIAVYTEGISNHAIIEIIKYTAYTNSETVVNELIINVCYDKCLASDIEEVVKYLGMSHEEIVNHHLQSTYYVAMVGFLPGFVYLGGGSKLLSIPRKSTPSKKVAKGAVAIASTFTGIYPLESPGGWNVIGQTHFENFDINGNPICKINVGDVVKFTSIDLQTYKEIMI